MKIIKFIIPPPNEVGGGVSWIHLVRPSVRLSVWRTHYKTYTGYLSINLSGYHYWLLPVHYWLAKFTMHNWTLIGVSVQIMLGKSLT